MSANLQGRRVVITGGARGIGRATAEALVAAGARVAIGDIDQDLVRETAAAIGDRFGTTVLGAHVDVSDRASFEEFLGLAELELGGLDVLVNNAGIMPTGAFLDETDLVTDRQIGVNIRGVILGSKIAAARFTAQGHGQIVNLGSVVGIEGAPGLAVYSATKHAVIGLGAVLRQELAESNVVVSTIAPGFVRTELIAGMKPNALIEKVAMVGPEDVAAAIVDVITKRRPGLRYVPRAAGVILGVLKLLPEATRYRLSAAFGLQKLALNTDETARAAYRQRTEAPEPRTEATSPAKKNVSGSAR
ncbi:SDR family NAD(P)-dependent oxidoreductase [Rhodococcus sp. Z13]|uniref:SDR family NAD(P)-dependent oxidoreductase n=1 Tax=Rhodococcus sacchari TaxID=2962047 RepID=A0ACD4DB73_9NOCA|nr:SDR family NAD(P)-dependent oxidoreductase [Rhodococcus sp. Z13]UYP17209.1 SDR family NAD(P)-dependent oxidoreductase [Rhodococcus sp. Z13]